MLLPSVAIWATGLVVPAAPAQAQGYGLARIWSVTLPDAGAPVAQSSPDVATLDGMPAVVVGDRAGYVYALSLASGAAVPGWPVATGAGVDSTPSVAALTAGSPDDTVFVGVGDAATPAKGGYEAISPNGTEAWFVTVENPSSDHRPGEAVIASLAVGDLQGGTDVVAPSVGQEEYALNADNGATLTGFPWFTSDSDFSTPALADLYGNGKTEIVEGGDQSAGIADGVTYDQGGHLRVIAPTGTAGTNSPSGGLDCQYNTDQGVESSPAVGQFLAGGAVGIVVGTSNWPGGSDADKVLAFDSHCNLLWAANPDGSTTSSPALADIMGNGSLDVVEGVDNGTSGAVWALNGQTGAPLWQQAVSGRVMGSVVTADLGTGYQDVIVPTTHGADVLDGRTGQLIETFATTIGLQNAPLVTDDPNGTIGVTVAGYNGNNQGVVMHFELAGSNGANADEAGAWPMFHHDPQLSGNADVPVGAAPSLPVSTCSPPAGGPNGYYEVSSGGSVFNYGDLPFCGSLATSHLLAPLVGLAVTPDGGGYWTVASNGQVSAFGDARPYGSAILMVNQSIVGIAATPDGLGYWLVAQDGEVFAFGDAKPFGPRTTLGKTIVGIAPTSDGGGYWLAARNGRVFGFGDALPQPVAAQFRASNIVAIAPDSTTGGYWLAAANGSGDSFGAPLYGTLAGRHVHYAVTGLEAVPDGSGYRMVDAGGALFCFGSASDQGSAGKLAGSNEVVGIAGP
jgi:hypothetical protein